MTIEDDLAAAMAAHVSDVRAAPGLGRAVRRRHHARVIRFRTAGAALLTAAVAAAVPVAMNLAGTAGAGEAANRAVMTEPPSGAREYAGLRLEYLPEGLAWIPEPGDGLVDPPASYIAGFDKLGDTTGRRFVQLVVAHGESALERIGPPSGPGTEVVDVNGRQARLATMSQNGEVVPYGTGGGTPTIAWELRPGLAVELCVSPEYAEEIDAAEELKKIARGIREIG
ncbi:hypothetical protein [Nonomuraea rubra]|uniref:Uncharacterized protein n=1 Tax=Nonomuraea rubra TaxID=46180 RepID=A0A7X0P5U0_9ACTN|nr:hypothetical protein [Nonomuraea rubra]MBB6555806.1 hypothetical protein [Nonomuraea rubra]